MARYAPPGLSNARATGYGLTGLDRMEEDAESFDKLRVSPFDWLSAPPIETNLATLLFG
jgi:hypothetical protein